MKKILFSLSLTAVLLLLSNPEMIAQENALGIQFQRDRALIEVNSSFNPSSLPSSLLHLQKLDYKSYFAYFDHELDDEEFACLRMVLGITDVVKPIVENSALKIPTSSIFVKTIEGVAPIDLFAEFGYEELFVESYLFSPHDTTYLVRHRLGGDESEELSAQLSSSEYCVEAFPNYWVEYFSFSSQGNTQRLPNQPESYDYFADQWHLHNTGQYGGSPGVDINALCSWETTQGEGVKVAVFDNGVEQTHWGFDPNKLSWYSAVRDTILPGGGGWDIETNSPNCHDPHGTCCAGIIAATGAGLAPKGVAPNVELLSVTIRPVDSTLYVNGWDWLTPLVSDEHLANAIIYATDTAMVDVMSFSVGTTSVMGKSSDELKRAMASGRNGKGCVVVCSSGNSDDDMGDGVFPNKLDPVVVVGAITQCGERKTKGHLGYNDNVCGSDSLWGSSYGYKLDLVAPGTKITTLDLIGHGVYNGYNPDPNYVGDYSNESLTRYFCGTSASSPIVAGVAALTLSANPSLTSKEVVEILCRTARRLHPETYDYSTDPNHPYGSWNEEMGYGLVDACAAVETAINGLKVDYLIRDAKDDIAGREPYQNNIYWNSPDIKLLDIHTQEEITDIDSYDCPSCYVAVDIKNKSFMPSRNVQSERLYITYGKPMLKSTIDPLLPSWFPYSTHWVSSATGERIHSLDIKEHGIAAGFVLFELPTQLRQRYENIVDGAFSRYVISTGTNLSSFAKWGFSLMALADEGYGDYPEITNSMSAHQPDASLAKQYNSIAVNNGNRLLHDNEYAQLVAIAPPADRPFQINVRQRIKNEQYRLLDYAELYILLSDDLMDLLEISNDVEIIDGNILKISGNLSTLYFNSPSPNIDYFIGSEVHFISDAIPSEVSDFDYDIELIVEDSINDAARITAVRNPSVYFRANATATKHKVVRSLESTTLSSNIITEDATYTWLDEAGNIVGIGSQISLTPTQSHTYTVNIMRDDNGYFAQDTVSVCVVDGSIVSVSPNPSREDVVVEYMLTETSNSSIHVSNMNHTICYTYPISEFNGAVVITNGILPVGVYFVTLFSNGLPLDTKQLIIY